MSSTPPLGLTPPPPNLERLERRLGDFDRFLHDLIVTVEGERLPDGRPIASVWDIPGDPLASQLARLWAFVAEGVAAYTELTAGEAYIGTAADWSDLRRLAALVGFRPRPRVAAQGWVRAEVERGANPVVPAGTRVQAPATHTRAAQTFEVAAETALRGEWDGLTATWPLVQVQVAGASIRFSGDPGFRTGDRVLFVSEESRNDVPLAVATVVEDALELGTLLVRFDRDLAPLFASGDTYAAYRVVASAGSARRLEKVLTIPESGDVDDRAVRSVTAYERAAVERDSIVLDALLDELSVGRDVAVVDWGSSVGGIFQVIKHEPVHWPVAPGTLTRVSQIELTPSLGDQLRRLDVVTVYVVGERVEVASYELPTTPPVPPQLRLFPGPSVAPRHVAVETRPAGGSADARTWEVFACTPVSTPAEGEPLVVALDRAPSGAVQVARASGNVFPVRHGVRASAVLGSGDATTPGQQLAIGDAPLAYDVDEQGTPVPSLVLRVDGIRWDEVPTLYGQGPTNVFTARLGPDGGVTVQAGDGTRGARFPTGRNNVEATYRIGGGTAGEVESGAISALLGSVRGVKKVSGAGPTSGAADEDDERRLRRLAPARARAFGRVVTREDAVDLGLGYPGVTHAAAWHGLGPKGCACGRQGLHLAFVREGHDGPRSPTTTEVAALAAFLDARRDTTFALCVCAGLVTKLQLNAALALDHTRAAPKVLEAARAAVLDPDGPLSPEARALGQPLDPSDVSLVLDAVPGVVGIVSLGLDGAQLGTSERKLAARHELLLASDPALQAAVE